MLLLKEAKYLKEKTCVDSSIEKVQDRISIQVSQLEKENSILKTKVKVSKIMLASFHWGPKYSDMIFGSQLVEYNKSGLGFSSNQN